MTIAMEALRGVRADVLTGRIYELRRSERLMLVEFLTVLGKLERRNAVVGLGFSSMFDFLRRHLGYLNATAFRRKEAARASDAGREPGAGARLQLGADARAPGEA